MKTPPAPTFGRVAVALRRSWTATTSATPSWTPACPALGQCAVTALVVQDFFGGDLLRAIVCGDSHYWNRLSNGYEIDLTADQFSEIRLESSPEVRAREYVLSFSETARRYETLKDAVVACLGRERSARTLMTPCR